LDLLTHSDHLREKLHINTKYFREEMTKREFNILPGTHPIAPIMLGDAVVAKEMANRMLDKGIYVIGFSFPVVPKGQARIRTQISAAHSMEDLRLAIEKFTEVKEEMNLY
jgi:glycine C-acetyltransferase